MNQQRSKNYIYFSKHPEKDIDSTLVNHKLITTGYPFHMIIYIYHIYMISILYYLFIFASNFHIHRNITNINFFSLNRGGVRVLRAACLRNISVKLNWIIFVTAIVEDTSSWSKYSDHHLKNVWRKDTCDGKYWVKGTNEDIGDIMLCAGANFSWSAQVETFVCWQLFVRRRWRKRRLSGGQWGTTCFHGFHKSFNKKAFYWTQVRSLPWLLFTPSVLLWNPAQIVGFFKVVLTRWISLSLVVTIDTWISLSCFITNLNIDFSELHSSY